MIRRQWNVRRVVDDRTSMSQVLDKKPLKYLVVAGGGGESGFSAEKSGGLPWKKSRDYDPCSPLCFSRCFSLAGYLSSVYMEYSRIVPEYNACLRTPQSTPRERHGQLNLKSALSPHEHTQSADSPESLVFLSSLSACRYFVCWIYFIYTRSLIRG